MHDLAGSPALRLCLKSLMDDAIVIRAPFEQGCSFSLGFDSGSFRHLALAGPSPGVDRLRHASFPDKTVDGLSRARTSWMVSTLIEYHYF